MKVNLKIIILMEKGSIIGAVDTGVKAGGVTSYNDLEDKPTLNGETI